MCCEVISFVLSRSEKFLKVMRQSLTFYSVSKHSKVFSWLLSSSDRSLEVLRRFLLLWVILGYSEAFLGVLMCFE